VESSDRTFSSYSTRERHASGWLGPDWNYQFIAEDDMIEPAESDDWREV
jgi:hypothetical protein